jgi:hypothetical protein
MLGRIGFAGACITQCMVGHSCIITSSASVLDHISTKGAQSRHGGRQGLVTGEDLQDVVKTARAAAVTHSG